MSLLPRLRGRPYFYVLNGKEVVPATSYEEFAGLFEDSEARRVALTSVKKAVVSTVFLCIDHGHGGGPPLLFETLVFGGDLDGEMDRYSTWAEAEEGHRQMVERVQEAQKVTP